MADDSPILEVRNLKKYFAQNTSITDYLLRRDPEYVHAVDDVSLRLNDNEVQGIIGESGCGKSTLLRTIIGLHEPTEGQILYKGEDISNFSRKEMKQFRKNVQIIFQDPFNSLDPKFTVRETLEEPLNIHNIDIDKTERIRETLKQVELQPVDKYIDRLPDQLSGGEMQRVSIGRALVSQPDVILADEPVSMLDVSIQASILNLMSDLIDGLGISMFYISHDLSTVSYVCDEISVMYLGRIIEQAPTRELLTEPKHPYSQALMKAIPIPDPHHQRERTQVDGRPSASAMQGEGCRFRDRCPERMDVCEKTPIDYDSSGEHMVACHLYYNHEIHDIDSNKNAGSKKAEGDD